MTLKPDHQFWIRGKVTEMDEAQIACKFPIGSEVECMTFSGDWRPAKVTGSPVKDKFWSIFVHIDGSAYERTAWPVEDVRIRDKSRYD